MNKFWKPCIVQFLDGTYGIRKFSFLKLQFVFKDFLIPKEELYKNTHFLSKLNLYFKRGDCKLENYDKVLEIFEKLITTKQKPLNRNKYNIIAYFPDEQV
jgi:hypothetical protein